MKILLSQYQMRFSAMVQISNKSVLLQVVACSLICTKALFEPTFYIDECC